MTTEKLDIIRRHYADTDNAELSDMLGYTVRYIKKVALNMGLRKSARYMKQLCIERAAHARYIARKNGFARQSAGKMKYHDVYANLDTIRDRWFAGESAHIIARDYGTTSHRLITILNRKGMHKRNNKAL